MRDWRTDKDRWILEPLSLSLLTMSLCCPVLCHSKAYWCFRCLSSFSLSHSPPPSSWALNDTYLPSVYLSLEQTNFQGSDRHHITPSCSTSPRGVNQPVSHTGALLVTTRLTLIFSHINIHIFIHIHKTNDKYKCNFVRYTVWWARALDRCLQIHQTHPALICITVTFIDINWGMDWTTWLAVIVRLWDTENKISNKVHL